MSVFDTFSHYSGTINDKKEVELMTLEAAIFLSMSGDASEAISFYKEKLGAKVLMKVTYEEMAQRDETMHVTDENKHYITHSVLLIGKTKIMLAEESMHASEPYVRGNNFSLCIQSADRNEIEVMYNNVVADSRASIIQPLSENVFSEAYGIVRDPFGVDLQFMYDKRLA